MPNYIVYLTQIDKGYARVEADTPEEAKEYVRNADLDALRIRYTDSDVEIEGVKEDTR